MTTGDLISFFLSGFVFYKFAGIWNRRDTIIQGVNGLFRTRPRAAKVLGGFSALIIFGLMAVSALGLLHSFKNGVQWPLVILFSSFLSISGGVMVIGVMAFRQAREM